MSDGIIRQLTTYGEYGEEASWEIFKNHYLMKSPRDRIENLQAVDTFLELQTAPTREHASLITKRRELLDIHNRLRSAGR
jgi:hypothetical protein